MEKVKKIIAVICFCTLVYLCSQFFRYILVDDTSSYTRIMMHELYNQEENIDILFLGSSHCYRSFVPEIMDEAFGKNTYNAGSSSQYMDASYYLLQEAAKENDIEQVYLELYYAMAVSEAFKERELMTSTYIVSDYMKPSFQKLKFLLDASSKEHYSNSFIVARRNWEHIFDVKRTWDIVRKKQTPDYRNYEYTFVTHEEEAYLGKGYVANFETIQSDMLSTKGVTEPIDISRITDDWKNTLIKIIEFCEKEDIKLVLVSSPMTEYLLAEKGNYDAYIEVVDELIKDTDVEYYDFNLCKEEYFPNTMKYYYDVSHLNEEGAEAFSTVFTDFFTGQISEEELFYDSYEERLQNLEPEIYGLTYWENEDRDDFDVMIVSNPYGNLEYRIEVQPEEGNTYIVQDYSDNKEFTLPKEETGICVITVRNQENADEVIQTVEIPFSY